MKFIYPAYLQKRKTEPTWIFPDLECCYADGDTLTMPLTNANEAAITLSGAEDDCNLPSVSDKEDMELQEGDIVRNISKYPK